MYTAGMLPVAQQRFTAMLITTTPGPPDSYIMIQAAKRDENDDPLMPCLVIGDPCKDCKAVGNYMCAHNQENAPWKSTTNRSKFGFFYDDDKETDAAENYATLLMATNYGFRHEYIEKLKKAPRWHESNPPGYLVLAADACGGGKDEFALTIKYTSRDHHVILAMDSARVAGADPEEVQARLFGLIRKIRSIDTYRNVPMLFIPENAPGPIGETYNNYIRREQSRPNHGLGVVYTIREFGSDRRCGVPKTKESTAQMVRYVADLMRCGQIVFSDELMGGLKTTAIGMMDKLYKQLREYKYEIKHNKNDPHSEPKGKWMGTQDDLLISLMTAIYWESMFWNSTYEGYEPFKRLCSKHGGGRGQKRLREEDV